jgi:hypothetical protein
MMLALLMTRQDEVDRKVIGNCAGLRFLVLDELHTYRGRQGADVATSRSPTATRIIQKPGSSTTPPGPAHQDALSRSSRSSPGSFASVYAAAPRRGDTARDPFLPACAASSWPS